MSGIIGLFIAMLFICVVASLFYWVIGALKTPDPLGNIARVGIIFVASLIVLLMLYHRFGGGYIGLH